ncbi:MAG: hypothetical protein R2749_23340 [Acidimicrobiales bacterium]
MLVPVPPARVFEGFVAGSPLPATSFVDVPLDPYVPVGTTAVAVNLSRATRAGMPFGLCGDPPTRSGDPCPGGVATGVTPGDPATSMFAIVPLGPARMLRVVGVIYDSMVAVDVLGYFIDGGATPTAGRYRPIEPHRVLDTRQVGGSGVGGSGVGGSGVGEAPAGPVDDTSVTVSVDGVVPADSGAVLATVQLVDVAPMRTVSNLALVPVTDGRFEIDVQGRAHVVVDVVGSFTSAASAPGVTAASWPPPPPARWYRPHRTVRTPRRACSAGAWSARWRWRPRLGAVSRCGAGPAGCIHDRAGLRDAVGRRAGAVGHRPVQRARDPRHPGGRAGARRPFSVVASQDALLRLDATGYFTA